MALHECTTMTVMFIDKYCQSLFTEVKITIY